MQTGHGPDALSKLWKDTSPAATAQGEPFVREDNRGSQPCQRRHLGQLQRSWLIKSANSGISNFNTGRKGAFPEKVPIIVRSTTESAPDVFSFDLTESETIPNPTRSNGLQQHFVSFSLVRIGKELMRTIYVETMLTSKSLSLAKVISNIIMPCLTNGPMKVPHWLSHRTQ